MEGFRDHMAGCSESFGEGVGDSSRINIADCDEGATRLARHGGHEEADGTCAYDECGGTWGGRSSVECVDGYGEGFEERRDRKSVV